MRRAVPYVIGAVVVALILYAFQPGTPVGAGRTAPDVFLRLIEGASRNRWHRIGMM